MKLIKKYVRKMRVIGLCCMTATGLTGMITLPVSGKGFNQQYYQVLAGEKVIGVFQSEETAVHVISNARTKAAQGKSGMYLSNLHCHIEEIGKVFSVDSTNDSIKELCSLLEENEVSSKTGMPAYTMKINDFIITLGSKEEIAEALDKVKDQYDPQKEYRCELTAEPESQENVMTATIAETVSGQASSILAMNFEQKIEVVPAYVGQDEVKTVTDAVLALTKEEEKNTTHTVMPGDCLSLVAEEYNMTVQQIQDLNLMAESDVIYDGDELVITVPEPVLAVIEETQANYTEEYQTEVIYQDNDNWYTNKQVVKSEGTTGVRDVTARIVTRNGVEKSREILQENISQEAQPKIIERGTQVPPTYIKPLAGGRFTSPFGKRWGRMHKGVDWSCSVGTAIKASCGGKVVSAGWANGYGNCVVLSHSDGKQTRYAHLSKILVSVGQKVAQGEKIALSGNTGNSTGPHLHFEILIGGVQANPMKYLK